MKPGVLFLPTHYGGTSPYLCLLYTSGRDMGAIIVFDAADNELSQGSRTKIGGVQVIFSRPSKAPPQINRICVVSIWMNS